METVKAAPVDQQVGQPVSDIWVPFVRASIGLALGVGFTLGTIVASARGLGYDRGVELAATQVHGHIQIFGWGGLMVVGIALHFLPRLLGVTLGRPERERARRALKLLVGGMLLRSLAGPVHALGDGLPGGWIAHGTVALALAIAGALELTGASLALLLLGKALFSQRPPGKVAASRPLLLLLATAFASFWLALAFSSLGLALAAVSGDPAIPERVNRLAITLGLHGFLVPVSLAMTARLFPLYLRTPAVRQRWFAASATLLLSGLALRLLADFFGFTSLADIARLIQAGALVVGMVALGVFGRRRPLPRRTTPLHREPLQLYGLSAYLWLACSALVLAVSGGQALGLDIQAVNLDAERHALGAGFVTLLILGMGTQLIPGFARRPLRSEGLRWAVLALGNSAAALRVASGLLQGRSVDGSALLAASAGIAALLAIALFALNVGFPFFAPNRPESALNSAI